MDGPPNENTNDGAQPHTVVSPIETVLESISFDNLREQSTMQFQNLMQRFRQRAQNVETPPQEELLEEGNANNNEAEPQEAEQPGPNAPPEQDPQVILANLLIQIGQWARWSAQYIIMAVVVLSVLVIYHFVGLYHLNPA